MNMHAFRLHPGNTRPYFAEVPYYVWGEVNYGSEGDCAHPRDRSWTSLELTNRKTDEWLAISTPPEEGWTVEGSGPAAIRACFFLVERCGARWLDGEPALHEAWDRSAARERAAEVAREFEEPALAPFDSRLFWGSWKWIGWFATDFTWVGRWIMHSVVRQDVRAVALCVSWLRQGTFSPEQSVALRSALSRLTGETLATDAEWVRWYDGAQTKYPEPDLAAWLRDLKSGRAP